ncbi:MAG: YkgJ family cysteine cluster protein [Candidatus Omnitrophica bacterium]|nr:YkgJ family cysteine cluster protein [Candidatus Omnitrophota bacterium]
MKPKKIGSKKNVARHESVVCRGCGLGRCCREGVEVDLFEAAEILKRPLDIPRPWFIYQGRDKRFPSGFVFSTVLRHRRCVFQNEQMRCVVYDIRPRYCREFPLEDGRKAPYYHHLCHHAPRRKKGRGR